MSPSAKRRLIPSFVLVTICTVTIVPVVLAADITSMDEHADVLIKLVAALLGLVVTFLTGFTVWLISNQKELFIRVGSVETKIETLRAVCEERHD